MDISARHTCPSCGAQSTVALTVTPHPTGADDGAPGGGDGAASADATENPGGSTALDERNRARTAAARDRIAEAVDALRADGADVTPSAVRKRTGMDLRTINRHRDLLDEEKS